MKLAEIEVHGSLEIALFDSSVVPDVVSVALCRKLHITPHETTCRITTADNKEALVLGEASQVSVTAGPVTTELSCLMVRNTP